jgi:hypothetical protein
VCSSDLFVPRGPLLLCFGKTRRPDAQHAVIRFQISESEFTGWTSRCLREQCGTRVEKNLCGDDRRARLIDYHSA